MDVNILHKRKNIPSVSTAFKTVLVPTKKNPNLVSTPTAATGGHQILTTVLFSILVASAFWSLYLWTGGTNSHSFFLGSRHDLGRGR
jgi:hypothetical protein